jgi:SnoaL-like domain
MEAANMDRNENGQDLEDRVRALEDKLAILQIVAGYGPSVDGGAVQEAGSLWTEQSWYDTDSTPAASKPHGRAGIEAATRQFLDDPVGLAHISHLPLIRVEGDRAIAINHSNTFHQDGDSFRLGRVSSNRWELVRVGGSWQIERRVNRLMNGSSESKAVLADGTRDVFAEEATSRDTSSLVREEGDL